MLHLNKAVTGQFNVNYLQLGEIKAYLYMVILSQSMNNAKEARPCSAIVKIGPYTARLRQCLKK